MKSKSILVPTDFTQVAKVAVEHGIKLAKTIQSEIILLHVVKDLADVDGAEKKLDAEIELISNGEPGVKVTPAVRVGNIFDDIGETASAVNAELIIMGTHGASGWQKFMGSHALKVITNSSVPFIVVQNKGVKETGYDDIVVPLDLSQETKQKLELVGNMAQYFKSRVHLLVPKETDEYLVHKVNGNIVFAKKYLSDLDIKLFTKIVPKSGFTTEIIRYASGVDADLIAIMNLQKNSIMGLMGSSYEQHMITNDTQIPVMCVNPLEATVSGGSILAR